MRRRLFTIASALSLLLCAATCALWVRSYHVRDSMAMCDRAAGGFRWRFLESHCGRIHIVRVVYRRDSEGRFETYPPRLSSSRVADGATWDEAYRGGRTLAEAHLLGFAAMSGEAYDGGASDRRFSVWSWPIRATVVPFWPLALATAILPASWLRKSVRERRRLRHNRCRACGYDLRATPRAGGDLLPRCPECGAGSGGEVRA